MPIYPSLHGDIYKEEGDPEELKWKRDLYQQRARKKVEKQGRSQTLRKAAGTTERTAGIGTERGGTALKAAGTTMRAAGTATQAAGRSLQAFGRTTTSAGTHLTSSVIGAPIGIPLMIGGAAVTGTGGLAQGLGAGMRTAGRGMQIAGQTTQRTGRALKKRGQRISTQKAPAPQSLSAPAQMLSAHLLRSSWLMLIPSFGLTLIWINIHFIGAYIVGSSWFCNFGTEWTKLPIKSNISGSSASFQSTSRALEIAEIIALFTADLLIAIFFIFPILAPIFVIALIAKAVLDKIPTILRKLGELLISIF